MSTDKQEQHILDEHVKTDGDAYARSEELRRDTEDGEYNGVAFNSRDGVMARRKVDMYLVSTLTLYYFLSYLDRSNLGNARVAGLNRDLGMTGNDYNIALTTYFIPYILFEYPLAISLKKVGPDKLLPVLVLLWGLVTTCQGWITTYSGLLACRFFLGLFEAGLTPCAVILMSMYVKRFSLQKRIAVFFAMISLAGAFSGLLAFAITNNLTGRNGHAGWRWIFWLEGGATMFFPLVTFWIIPSSPSKARWLTAPQKAALLAGLEADNSAYVENEHDKDSIFSGLKLFTTSPVFLWYLGVNASGGFFTNGLPYFIFVTLYPPIINGLGYTSVRAQLFTVPPYATAFILALVGAVIGDWSRKRTWILAFCGVLATTGYAVYLSSSTSQLSIRYGSLFLIVGGSGPLSASLSAWGLSNASPHIRRATLIASGFMTSNTVSLCSVWSFRETEAPRYLIGSYLGVVASVALLVAPLTCATRCYFLNKRRDRELATYDRSHVWPQGPIADTDVRFRYSY